MPKLILPSRPPKTYLEPPGPENPLLGGNQLPWSAKGVGDQERGNIEDWDPAGDIYVPANDGAQLFVPPMEAAPPQLPSPMERSTPLEFAEPHGIQAFVDTAAAPRPPTSLGFMAHAVLIDNLSSKWIYFPSAQRYVPPTTVGVMLTLVPGTQIAQFTQVTPTGHGDGSIGVGGPITTVWYEDYIWASAGVAATV